MNRCTPWYPHAEASGENQKDDRDHPELAETPAERQAQEADSCERRHEARCGFRWYQGEEEALSRNCQLRCRNRSRVRRYRSRREFASVSRRESGTREGDGLSKCAACSYRDEGACAASTQLQLTIGACQRVVARWHGIDLKGVDARSDWSERGVAIVIGGEGVNPHGEAGGGCRDGSA